MRDAFGEIDPDEIDIIDADPLTFGPSEHLATSTDDPAEPLARRRSRWLTPVAIGGTAALAIVVVAVTLLVWQPWENHDGIKISFPSAAAGTATLTAELVFAGPPADLTAAHLADSTNGGEGGLFLPDAEGYLFAEPDATFRTGRGGTGRWAAFFAAPVGGRDAPTLGGGDPSTTVTVQGTPGLVTTSIGSRTTQINFGPLGGNMFSVATSELSRAESLAFAEAVSLDHGTPVLNDSSVLGDMRPLGTIADFASVVGLSMVSGEPGLAQADIVFAQYGSGGKRYSVSSRPSFTSDLTMVSFFFGGGEEATVHGHPALAFEINPDDPLLAFGSGSGSVIAWVEGGQLVMVTGPDGGVATSALAESVRSATDAEWADVTRVAANTVDPTSEILDRQIDDGYVDLDSGVDGETGVAYTFRARIDGGQLSTCISEATNTGASNACRLEQRADLPLLTTQDWNGHRFVLAVVAADVADNPELHVTLADGTVKVRPLNNLGDAFPGPARGWLLPDDAGTVELWSDDGVVATLPN